MRSLEKNQGTCAVACVPTIVELVGERQMASGATQIWIYGKKIKALDFVDKCSVVPMFLAAVRKQNAG